jgi:hypothetical protein
MSDSGPASPAWGNIGWPAPGDLVPRTPVIVTGWALGPDGPLDTAILLVDGHAPTEVRLGAPRPDVAAEHPDVADAERSGWDAIVDLRGVAGPGVGLTLVGRTGQGDWVEIDRSELRLQPAPRSEGRRAAFTIVQNEATFLPLWVRYYGRHFAAEDLYVLDHGSSDGSVKAVADRCNVMTVHRDRTFDHVWLKGIVEDFFAFLLRSYPAVLFSDVDEFVVADPARHAGLGAYIDALTAPAACCSGYNIVQYPEEGALDFEMDILAQRHFWHPAPKWYSKRLLGRVPLSWNVGLHEEYNVPAALPDPDLRLVHLHRVDYDRCLARHRSVASRRWSEQDLKLNLNSQARVVEPDAFREWFYAGEDLEGSSREAIPERFRTLL